MFARQVVALFLSLSFVLPIGHARHNDSRGKEDGGQGPLGVSYPTPNLCILTLSHLSLNAAKTTSQIEISSRPFVCVCDAFSPTLSSLWSLIRSSLAYSVALLRWSFDHFAFSSAREFHPFILTRPHLALASLSPSSSTLSFTQQLVSGETKSRKEAVLLIHNFSLLLLPFDL